MKSRQAQELSESRLPRASVAARLPAAAAVVTALALAVSLAVRPMSSTDLGYHLAYGDHFLDTGEIVDHSDCVYTLPPLGGPRAQPGPGCWYNADGRYRFPNANWLSQIIMSGVHRWGGSNGLCMLQLALWIGVFALLLLAMRHMQVPWLLAAVGLILAAMASYPRFSLRPEVFGYLLLMAQFSLLLTRKLTWGVALAVIVLQMLFVNLHSYFLLGILLTGAVLAEALLHYACPPSGTDRRAAACRARRVAALLGAQVAVCFFNPWTWRLAALPIQTLVFLRANNLADGTTSHPWRLIGELSPGFISELTTIKAVYACFAVLGLAGIGALCCLLRRRWSYLLVILGFAAVSWSVRRNIACGGLVIVPVAMAALWPMLRLVGGRLATRQLAFAAVAISLAACIFACAMTVSVVSNRFYFNERSSWRFGWGLSALELPLAAGEHLSAAPLRGRLWTNFSISSNIHYFTRPHPPVPILTNTWAYPPETMQTVFDYFTGKRPFSEAQSRYGLSAVALEANRANYALIRQLARADDWSLTSIGGHHVVFRAGGAIPGAVSHTGFDTRAYIETLERQDPVPGWALYSGGKVLRLLGWDGQAAEVLAAAIRHEPDLYEAWSLRGACLAHLGDELLRRTGNDVLLQEARRCFRQALNLRPGYEQAQNSLEEIDRRLRQRT